MTRIHPTGPATTDPSAPADDRPRAAVPPGLRFDQVLQDARLEGVRSRLDQHLQAVDRLAAALLRSRTVENLYAYRNAVRAFLSEIHRAAAAVRSETGWDPHTWEQRSLVVVQRIDQDLDALAGAILAGEPDHLALLALTGEIRGLLLDLRI